MREARAAEGRGVRGGEGRSERAEPTEQPKAGVVALGPAGLCEGFGNQEAITWMPRADCVLEPQP